MMNFECKGIVQEVLENEYGFAPSRLEIDILDYDQDMQWILFQIGKWEYSYDGITLEKREGKAYRYYSTQRPVDIGTSPKTKKVIKIKNFDERIYVNEIERPAWGYIEYAEKLDDDDADAYELVDAEILYVPFN